MKKYFLFLPAILLLNSCAVLFQGSKKDVSIKSMTPGTSIYIDGEKVGADLVVSRLTRKSNHSVLLQKEGFNSKTIEIKKHTQVGWIIFDSLCNWFAFATDAPTGAWNTFDKDNIVAELEPVHNSDAGK